jgi:hypothetical protein
MAQASRIKTPTSANLAGFDGKRAEKDRNTEWRHPHDADARITR